MTKWFKKKILQLQGYEFKKLWDYDIEMADFRWKETLLPFGWDVWKPIDVKYNRKRMTTMYTFEVYKLKEEK